MSWTIKSQNDNIMKALEKIDESWQIINKLYHANPALKKDIEQIADGLSKIVDGMAGLIDTIDKPIELHQQFQETGVNPDTKITEQESLPR